MSIQLNTKKQFVPMIYAYSTPQIAEHDGWTKIGYTEKDVLTRIKEQTQTSDVKAVLEWKGRAAFDDESGDSFTDKAFHAYLRKSGIENKKNTEWFHVNGPEGQQKFFAFRSDRGILKAMREIPYCLRSEQAEAVRQTLDYMKTTEQGEFLWNAKPRFGKSLSAYDFCKKAQARKVLIVTNRPAIANSWYSDYVQFMGDHSGFKFVSETDALKGQPYVLSRNEYLDYCVHHADRVPGCIRFVSLQDLKGSKHFGGSHDKLEDIKDLEWDILIIDEAHEGVDTTKTDTAFEQIKRKFTLHLSGTPFKVLAKDKFPQRAIFNWTYADEQRAKRDWPDENEAENPYAVMPKLHLYTYQMSEIIREEIERGLEIDGEEYKYAAFDLNDLFETKNNGSFVRDHDVDKFLDALTTLTRFPFSTEELRCELKHTFWLLHRVDSAKALAHKLRKHPVFKEYKIVLAAGDGKLDTDEEIVDSYHKVRDAIANHDKTITLSVGQLTTGVTIPEWTAVLMLSNVKSSALYMQAAFRAQNPWLYFENGNYYRKQNAYVFDFDPARTLIIFEEFADDLCADTANGKGDSETRKENVRELLNFFPVIGEDEHGEMVSLDAEKVLTIPRKIKSQEVVRRGFMSNYLFQNISGIFSAPPEVIDIITAVSPNDTPIHIEKGTAEKLKIGEDGEVHITGDDAIEKRDEIFGPRIFEVTEPEAVEEKIDIVVESAVNGSKSDVRTAVNLLMDTIKKDVVRNVVETLSDTYGGDLRTSDTKQVAGTITRGAENTVTKVLTKHNIKKADLDSKRQKELTNQAKSGKSEQEIITEYAEKQRALDSSLKETLTASLNDYVDKATIKAVQTVETKIKEREKNEIEDTVRKHLRGFSRTIPSFLMAYGDDTVTLSTFGQNIPDQVFKDVTSITLDQFRFLRDGGAYTDAEGNEQHFRGNLFDPVVFDDSVKEFLRLKKELADYFNPSSSEDIFDYIPPQKTNQIFTPKKVVQHMVDLLEQENPGCFKDPEHTFIDLYMKSGLYITEIVKRLYQNEEMQIRFPDPKERLRHIFERQVYGLAPTEIIYRISLAYILGFDETKDIVKHNFRRKNALTYAQNGTLSEKLDEWFGQAAFDHQQSPPHS